MFDRDPEQQAVMLFDRIGVRDGEDWRSVATPAFRTDDYRVSSHGRVVSMPRWRDTATGRRLLRGKLLRPSPQRSGHLRVNLQHGGEKHLLHVHRLVLWAFGGPPPPGAVVRHLDGDPANNHLDNLVYAASRNAPLESPETDRPLALHIEAPLRRRIEAAVRGEDNPVEILAEIQRRLSHRYPSPTSSTF